jgi:hypothetical protein
VEYKKGVDNKVVDALSWREGCEENVSISLLSIPTTSWIAEIKNQYQEDGVLQNLLAKWHSNSLDTHKYSLCDGLLLYEGRILLGDNM